MGRVRLDIELDADRFSVWEFATDPLRFSEYVSGYERGESTSENHAGFGASYRWQARLGPLRLRAIESIVGWDPPAEVHYDGKLMGVPFRSCLRVDDLGSDRSRLTATIDSEPPAAAVLGRLADFVVAFHLRRSLDRLERHFPNASADGLSAVRRVYAVWGRHPHLYAAQDWITFLGRPHEIRRRAVAAMAVAKGERVLELACGTGRNFSYIEAAIGADGQLVGFDLSTEMLASARAQAARSGWHNVQLVPGDAAVLDGVAGPFDGVLCVLGMSAIPDMAAAVERCHDVLRPGGILSVCDARLFTSRLGRVINPAVRAVYTRLAEWDPERDVPEAIRRVFGNLHMETCNGGSFFVAHAIKR